MVDLDDQVVEVVVAAQPVAWLPGNALERSVIAPVAGVFAPGVVGADAANRQGRLRPWQAVGAPP
jgi:hypothetical protein